MHEESGIARAMMAERASPHARVKRARFEKFHNNMNQPVELVYLFYSGVQKD
jgi:hypothetical protein